MTQTLKTTERLGVVDALRGFAVFYAGECTRMVANN